MEDLIRLTAREAVAGLKNGDFTPIELIDAAERRVEQVDGAVNALVTRCFDRARAQARAQAQAQARARTLSASTAGSDAPGRLHGLPIAIKDLTDVAGVRTTLGSPLYAERVPERSDIVVETLERHGALVVGKSNTPEFGAGAQTFNDVFGTTKNPWNTALTPAGSSGGAATALATGMVWLAHGSDLGGSLRVPAAFCGVVGLRPSLGRVAHGPSPLPFASLNVEGPMGRTVGDVALMLDAMAGNHRGDPWSRPAPPTPFVNAVDFPRPPRRIAWSPDLGIAPVETEIKEVCLGAVRQFAAAGVKVEEDRFDVSDAESIFQTLRAATFAARMAPVLAEHRDALKPEVVWNIEKGLALTADDIGQAERGRGALYQRAVGFFDDFDLLVCPTTVVPPFNHELRYVREAGGVTFDSYIGWLALTFAITLTGCPALSMPCGRTSDGLPIGLQLIAAPGDEAGLLSGAARLEQALGLASAVPIDPRLP